MILGLSVSEWTEIAIAVLEVALIAVLGRWLIDVLIRRGVGRLVGRTRTSLDDMLLDAVRGPIYWFAVAAVTESAVKSLSFLPLAWRSSLDDAFFIVYTLLGLALVWRIIGDLFEWYGKELALRTETDLDEQLIPILRRVVLLIIALVALAMVLDRFNVDVTGIIATLGIGSLAIALAAQTSLSDIFSGFIIMVDRPYRIHDRIEIQDLNTWGDVVDIGLRSTRIRTRDNRMVIIPNSVMGKSLIVNHSFPNTHYRIDVHAGVAYGTDIELARRTMIEAAAGVDGVWQENPVEALFMEMADSALIFRIRVWIQSYADARRVIDRVNTAVYTALQAAGISIPFPQRTLHHRIDSVDEVQLGRLVKAARD